MIMVMMMMMILWEYCVMEKEPNWFLITTNPIHLVNANTASYNDHHQCDDDDGADLYDDDDDAHDDDDDDDDDEVDCEVGDIRLVPDHFSTKVQCKH